jgi:deazaflavin-dependent oxidoreductase (nitroreductase family)
MARTSDAQQAPRTPPPWLNRLMAGMLRTPFLERWIGRGTALLSVTGRRSGRTYTTPVTYARDGDRVTIASHVRRTWWRNLPDRPRVELRLAGADHTGTARVLRGDDPQAEELLRAYLTQHPATARAQGVGRDADGRLRAGDLQRVLADSVIVDVQLDQA